MRPAGESKTKNKAHVMSDSYSQDELDNHANQLNSNNDAYWDSRGYDGRPDDWQERGDDD